jgi:hypothetical protein
MAQNVKEKYKPFSSYVARNDNLGNQRTKIQILPPRIVALDSIQEQIDSINYSKESRILPILGSAGYGKTALYHALKDGSIAENAHIIYIPTPSTETTAVELFPNMYFELIRQKGINVLQESISNLKKEFGTLENAIQKLVGKEALIAEMLFALSEEKFHKTAKFLLTGLKLENPILPEPGNLIEDEGLCFSALKVISDYSDKPIIYFFDEIEGLFVSYGGKPAMQLLERMKRLYNEHNNTLIILACLTQVWEKILDESTLSTVSRFENPVLLKRFSRDDLEEYISKEMHYYLTSQMGTVKPQNSLKYWPFTDEELDKVLQSSGGNPRELIKSLRGYIINKKDIFNEFTKKKIEIDAFWLKSIKNFIKENDQTKKYTLGTFDGNFGPQINLKKENNNFVILLSLNRTLDQLSGVDKYIEENVSDDDYEIIFISEFEPNIVKNEFSLTNHIIQIDPEKTDKSYIDQIMSSLLTIIS